MSQDYNNDLSSAALSVLKERMEGNFDAVATFFSGSSAPTPIGVGHYYYDTDTFTPLWYNGTDFVSAFQASDATLTAIAALTFSADTYMYATGADTLAVGTITSFTRTLLDDADASTWRTTLGLVIGTNVQAYDAGLLSIAALTTRAGTIPYTTEASVYSTFSSTSFGRSLSNAAGAEALRTLAALGTIATQSAASVAITGGSVAGITDLAVADGGTGASDAAGAATNLNFNPRIATTIDNSLLRHDGTTGLVQSSPVICNDSGVITGVDILTAGTELVTPQLRGNNAAGTTLRTLNGTLIGTLGSASNGTGVSFVGSASASGISSISNKVIYRWASGPRFVPTSPAPSDRGNGFISFNATGAILQYDLDLTPGDIVSKLGCFCFDVGDNTMRVKVDLVRVDPTTIASTTIATIYAGPAAGTDIGESSGSLASITPHTVIAGALYSILLTVEKNTSATITIRYASLETTTRNL